MNIGDKIQIDIKNPNIFTPEAYRNLQGKTGVVEIIDFEHMLPDFGKILVKFDVPAERFYINGSEHTHFWFASKNLKVI
jgi:hypothetical protein